MRGFLSPALVCVWAAQRATAARSHRMNPMRGEYKVPGGKLVAVDLEIADGRIARAAVSGDFFLEPDEALEAIDAAILGMPQGATVAQLTGIVQSVLGADVTMVGFTPEAVAIAVRRALVHYLEGVVLPAGGVPERPPDGDRHRLRREAHHRHVRAQHALHDAGQLGHRCTLRHAEDGCVDGLEGFVGFEEEVAADGGAGDPAVRDLEVDRDELAAGDLVLTAHGIHPMTPSRGCALRCPHTRTRAGERKPRIVRLSLPSPPGGVLARADSLVGVPHDVSWDEYNAHQLGRRPRPSLGLALDAVGPSTSPEASGAPTEGRVAVDLGCGEGVEVTALLG